MRTNTQDIIEEVENLIHTEEYQKAWQVIHENGKSIMMTNPKLCLMGIFALKAISRHQEALAFAKKWLQKDPDNCEFLTIAGELSENLFRYEEALRYFKRVDRISPSDANRTRMMQEIRYKLKQLSRQEETTNDDEIKPVKNPTERTYWRYIILIAPALVTALFYFMSVGIDSKYPFALALLTICLYFFAVYPLEIEKIRTLKKHYYNEGKIHFITYLIIFFEIIVIAIAALQFSCDCFANKNGINALNITSGLGIEANNTFWTYIFFFLNASVIFLWLQTKELKELTYGLRRFYFKTSLFLGLFYSAYATHVANIESLIIIEHIDKITENLKLFKDDMIPFDGKGNFFNFSKFDLFNLSSWNPSTWINKDHYDQANYYWDNLKIIYPNITGVWDNIKDKNICELLDFYNKVVSSVANKFFTAPFNYLLLMLINFNIVVGFILSIYIISVVRIFSLFYTKKNYQTVR